ASMAHCRTRARSPRRLGASPETRWSDRRIWSRTSGSPLVLPPSIRQIVRPDAPAHDPIEQRRNATGVRLILLVGRGCHAGTDLTLHCHQHLLHSQTVAPELDDAL